MHHHTTLMPSQSSTSQHHHSAHRPGAPGKRWTNNPCPLGAVLLRYGVSQHHFVIIQSPQAHKPLDRMRVHAGDGQTYLVRVDSMSYLSYQDTILHVRLESVRKSSYNQASISHICSGPVPQSQAITTTSQSPETHLQGIRPHALSHLCHLHPMHHACVPWRLVMAHFSAHR